MFCVAHVKVVKNLLRRNFFNVCKGVNQLKSCILKVVVVMETSNVNLVLTEFLLSFDFPLPAVKQLRCQ